MAAGANGLFADFDLDVELVPPLASGPEGVRRVAAGDADFCVTGVYYFLAAAGTGAPPPARFVASLARRSPLAGIVRADSAIATPADLAGARVGVGKLRFLVDEYEAALAVLGVGPAVRVHVDQAAPHAALRTGQADVSASWVDAVPTVRNRSDVEVRAVPIGPDVVTAGIVAADRVPDEVAARMAAAVAAALDQQRLDPKAGLDALTTRYPDIHPADALEAWAAFEPYAFGGDGPAMDDDRWQRTLAHARAAHGLPPRSPQTVYRAVSG